VTNRVPHLRVVVGVSCFVLTGFAVVSYYVLAHSNDEVTQGNVIGTWINFAMLAVGFWLGSSSGGKSAVVDAPTGKRHDPVHVTEEFEPEYESFPK
jgi:hypothetical protein